MGNSLKSMDVTKLEEFKPTLAMSVWIDTAINNPDYDVSKIANACNISRMSWYRWCKDIRFKKWFQQEWNSRLNMITWKLDNIGLKKAETDFKYWEAMQKRLGNLQSSGGSITNFSNNAFKVEFICDEY